MLRNIQVQFKICWLEWVILGKIVFITVYGIGIGVRVCGEPSQGSNKYIIA